MLLLKYYKWRQQVVVKESKRQVRDEGEGSGSPRERSKAAQAPQAQSPRQAEPARLASLVPVNACFAG